LVKLWNFHGKTTTFWICWRKKQRLCVVNSHAKLCFQNVRIVVVVVVVFQHKTNINMYYLVSFVQNGLFSADMLDYVGNCTMSRHLDLTHMDPLYIAEQLTCIDADLFKRLICYQCQSYFWSRRFKSSSAGDCVNTVRATVDQFNALARRVMASVVYNIHEKAYYRAKVICCWILVAQELRSLKNFNSLKAILSALQSEPVYRLRSAWSLVSADVLDFFQQLSRVFGEDDNSAAIRNLLVKEGTSKTAVGFGAKTRRVKLKRYRRTASCDMLEVRGTVPYLGTFLTDLSMIDTAFSDFTSGL
ncbi:Ral guanine nucleotide dissociation stimulator-like 1, partial [Trichinella britovi]